MELFPALVFVSKLCCTPPVYYHGLCVESRFGKCDVMSRPPVADWFQTHKFHLFRPNEAILARGTEPWRGGVGLDIADYSLMAVA